MHGKCSTQFFIKNSMRPTVLCLESGLEARHTSIAKECAVFSLQPSLSDGLVD